MRLNITDLQDLVVSRMKDESWRKRFEKQADTVREDKERMSEDKIRETFVFFDKDRSGTISRKVSYSSLRLINKKDPLTICLKGRFP